MPGPMRTAGQHREVRYIRRFRKQSRKGKGYGNALTVVLLLAGFGLLAVWMKKGAEYGMGVRGGVRDTRNFEGSATKSFSASITSTCLDAARKGTCEGSFSYVAPDIGADRSKSSPPLPYSPDPMSKTDISTCVSSWDAIVDKSVGNKQFPKSSYREDMIVFERFFSRTTFGGEGFYLEMGAFDGVAESNSRFFERCLGWSGLLIEASPPIFSKLVQNRPHAHKLNLAPTCGSDYETVSFLPTKYTNAAVVDETNAHFERSVKVHCGPLKSYLQALDIVHIDFFSLDVEGAELLVLQNFDFKAVTIDVIIVECQNANHKADDEKNLAVRQILQDAGFELHKNVVRNSDLYQRRGFNPV